MSELSVWEGHKVKWVTLPFTGVVNSMAVVVSLGQTMRDLLGMPKVILANPG